MQITIVTSMQIVQTVLARSIVHANLVGLEMEKPAQVWFCSAIIHNCNLSLLCLPDEFLNSMIICQCYDTFIVTTHTFRHIHDMVIDPFKNDFSLCDKTIVRTIVRCVEEVTPVKM